MVHRIALIRHGESLWNLENIFTGWTDVNLSEAGVKEATRAGKLLRTEDFQFDIGYTSVLKRAICTLQAVLDQLDQLWIPVEKSWRLNERHYGDLQGKNKAETAKKYGDEQVHIWRRSYDTPPAPLTKDDSRWPGKDRRYQDLSKDQIPLQESLKDTVERFLPFWHETIAPTVKSGKNVIIAAHGNSLRALVKYLDNISDKDIPSLEIPTGVPLIYELDDNLKPIRHYYVGTKEAFKRRLGFIGSGVVAERLARALLDNGVSEPNNIKYAAPDKGSGLYQMGLSHEEEAKTVAELSDVLFLFGDGTTIRKQLQDLRGLTDQHILVPVATQGDLDAFQEAAGGSARIVLAVPERDLEQPHPTLDLTQLGAPVKLTQGATAKNEDTLIVKTLFEAAGHFVKDEGTRQPITAGG